MVILPVHQRINAVFQQPSAPQIPCWRTSATALHVMDNVIPMLTAARVATATASSVCLIHASADASQAEIVAKAAVAVPTACVTLVLPRIA